MNQPSRMKQFLIIGGIIFGLLIIILTIVALVMNRNPYGEYINIVNYGQKVKNLSTDYENNIEARLYQAARTNSSEEFNGADVTDALIRDGSVAQTEVTKGKQYSGSFIVDIESRQESYKVQYAYSRDGEDEFTSGYPIAIGCVDPKDVIYESFKCEDGTTENTLSREKSIINFLPHETVSYTLSAELEGDSLVLRADLYIPSIDLSGDLASRQQTVSLYKNEVSKWMIGQGFNPEDYTFEYNYTDDGVQIEEEHDHHGTEELPSND